MAAILVMVGQDATVVVWLAPADRALSSGRAEWVGLVFELYIARRVRADITLRLDNIQVVNSYNDGHVEFEWDWLRTSGRDLAVLAWELDAERQRLWFGGLVAVHQLGHPENRKRPHEYDYHERYNIKVDALTHELTLGMPLCVSLKRVGRAQTRLWYGPLEWWPQAARRHVCLWPAAKKRNKRKLYIYGSTHTAHCPSLASRRAAFVCVLT